jgi:cell division protein ZapE
MKLPVQGRQITVPRAARGVAFYTFDELCGQPLAAADYLALGECFSTILLDGVPQLTPDHRNETVRFTTLIDTFYEEKVKLYIAAAVAPEQLCPAGDHAFAFQRTVSRLVEMQSEEYRQQAHFG